MFSVALRADCARQVTCDVNTKDLNRQYGDLDRNTLWSKKLSYKLDRLQAALNTQREKIRYNVLAS